jgi:transcriptional regulator with XRE-family HTH domain
MGAREFGQMVESARLAKGWTRADVAAAIGILPDGRGLDPTQIRRIAQGSREYKPGEETTLELVSRLIRFLGLPWEEAWRTVGLWPPDLDEDGYRRFREAAVTRPLVAVGGLPNGEVMDPISLKHRSVHSKAPVKVAA